MYRHPHVEVPRHGLVVLEEPIGRHEDGGTAVAAERPRLDQEGFLLDPPGGFDRLPRHHRDVPEPDRRSVRFPPFMVGKAPDEERLTPRTEGRRVRIPMAETHLRRDRRVPMVLRVQAEKRYGEIISIGMP